jgi:putative FmdB family regulatory protein
MPIFEYHCEECDTTFERLTLRPQSTVQLSCPECGSTKTAKIFSTFSTNAGNCGSVGSPGSARFS